MASKMPCPGARSRAQTRPGRPEPPGTMEITKISKIPKIHDFSRIATCFLRVQTGSRALCRCNTVTKSSFPLVLISFWGFGDPGDLGPTTDPDRDPHIRSSSRYLSRISQILDFPKNFKKKRFSKNLMNPAWVGPGKHKRAE